MITYLITTVKLVNEFGTFHLTPRIFPEIVEMEHEYSVEAWKMYMQNKEKEGETVIAISKLGENKWHYKK